MTPRTRPRAVLPAVGPPPAVATAREAARAAGAAGGPTHGLLTGTDVRAVREATEGEGDDGDHGDGDVTPADVHAAGSPGETTATRGLSLPPHGTDDGFHDPGDDPFAGDTPGPRDGPGFVGTVRSEGPGPDEGEACDPDLGNPVSSEPLPLGPVGLSDGRMLRVSAHGQRPDAAFDLVPRAMARGCDVGGGIEG